MVYLGVGMADKNVLIIEDNMVMAQLLSEKIAQEGLTPAHAQDGEAGLAAIKKKLPALVVIDFPLTTPLDGFQTLEKIRENFDTKKLTSNGISSRRSRRGGISIGKTLKR